MELHNFLSIQVMLYTTQTSYCLILTVINIRKLCYIKTANRFPMGKKPALRLP